MERVGFGVEEVGPTVLRLWGIATDEPVREMRASQDRVYHVSSRFRGSFVFKVTQASDENEMFLRAQFSFMRHLADRGFTVPAAVPTTFGHVMSRIVSTRGDACLVYLLTYIPGRTPLPIEHLRGVGLLVAQLRLNLKAFSHEKLDQLDPHNDWAIHNFNLLGLRVPSLSEERRRLTEAVLRMWERELKPRIPALEKSVIHSDIHDDNLVLVQKNSQKEVGVSGVTNVASAEPAGTNLDCSNSLKQDRLSDPHDPSNPQENTCRTKAVTLGQHQRDTCSVMHRYGIIDFGDITFSCSVFELATVLAYGMMQETRDGDIFLERGREVLQGYQSLLPLDALEREVLYVSVCCRYCIELVNTEVAVLTQGDEACVEYLTCCEQVGWRQLRRLLDMGRSEVHNRWFQL